MRLSGRLQTRRWREGTQEECSAHLLSARRAQLLEAGVPGFGMVLLMGLVWVFSQVFGFTALEALWATLQPAHGSATHLALLGSGALVFLMSYVLPVLLGWSQGRLLKDLAHNRRLLGGLVMLDKLRGEPYVLLERWAQERLETPIKVEVDVEGPQPEIRWAPDGDARVVEKHLTDVPPANVAEVGGGPAQGRVSLSERDGVGFDVTRLAGEPDMVTVSVRASSAEGGVDRVSFVGPRPAWMDEASYERLPALERDGVLLSSDNMNALLSALSELSMAQGKRVEALERALAPAVVVAT